MKFAALPISCLMMLAASSAPRVIEAQASTSSTQTYTTEFDGNENPLSEGGAWTHTGLDWTKVAKSNGIAYGTQTGNDGYNDSYAILSGYSPNQSGSAQVHLIGSIDASCSHEVEILLRWSDAAHSAKGYEVNLSFDGGYAQIVRWNGAYGDFTALGAGSYPGLKNGDTFSASINGNVISAFVNGTKIAEVTDSSYSSGNPGIGFFRRDCGAGSDFAFENFTATGDTTVRPMPPTNVTVQ